MTIAELFLKIGLKTEGREDFDRAVTQLGIGHIKAINLKYAIAGLGAAFTGLMYFAANAATSLYKFHLSTGISTGSLQQWQMTAARFNVSATDMLGTIKAVQDAQNQIALGQGDVAPWAMLGIDPRNSWQRILGLVHEKVKESGGMNASYARMLTSRMGISEDVFTMLRRDNFEVQQLTKQYQALTEEAKKFDQFSGEWGELKFKIETAGISLASHFLPPLEKFFDRVAKPGGPLDQFGQWLDRISADTPDGEKIRAKFESWAKGIAITTAAVIALNAALRVTQTLLMIGALGKIIGGGAAVASAGGAAAAGAEGTAAGGTGFWLMAGGITALLSRLLPALAPVIGAAWIAHKDPAEAQAMKHGFANRMKNWTWMPPWMEQAFRNLHRTPQGPGEARLGFFGRGWDEMVDLLMKPGAKGFGTSMQTSVVVHQTINGGANAAEQQREAAHQFRNILQKHTAAALDQAPLGAVAH